RSDQGGDHRVSVVKQAIELCLRDSVLSRRVGLIGSPDCHQSGTSCMGHVESSPILDGSELLDVDLYRAASIIDLDLLAKDVEVFQATTARDILHRVISSS